MSEDTHFDIIVIGGGPGGYVAAIHAAQKGCKTALIESDSLGGTCLNVGCIPTKSLIACTDVLKQCQRANQFGIQVPADIGFDWTAMVTRKDQIIEKSRQGIGFLLKSNGVTVFNACAEFITDHKIKLNGMSEEIELSSDKFIIATGSVSAVPGFIPKLPQIITSTEILSLPQLPKSLLILGGGVIGCELGSLMNSLGVKVTIVEMLPTILPMLDKEVIRTVTTSFKKAGITILTGAPMTNIRGVDNYVCADVNGTEVQANLLLVAIGRAPRLKSLNIEVSGVQTNNRGWITVNESCQTNISHIYAIGDITGQCQLAHAASAMGLIAVDHIVGEKKLFNSDLVPSCIFTHPEIGVMGLTTEQAEEKGLKVKSGKFLFGALGKAMAMGESDGFCKIISDATTDEILGAHIVGAHATDLISELSVAITNHLTTEQLGNTIHPHPTLGEIVMETAHAVHGTCIHQAPPRRR